MYWRLSLGMKIAFIAVSIVPLFSNLTPSGKQGSDEIFMLLLIALLGITLFWSVWISVRRCIEVVVQEDGDMEFKTLLYSDSLAPGSIRSISSADGVRFVLEHDRGRIYLSRTLEDFDELVSDIRRYHPAMLEEVEPVKPMSWRRYVRLGLLMLLAFSIPYIMSWIFGR